MLRDNDGTAGPSPGWRATLGNTLSRAPSATASARPGIAGPRASPGIIASGPGCKARDRVVRECPGNPGEDRRQHGE